MQRRRIFLAAAAGALLTAGVPRAAQSRQRFELLEQRSGGRLGVFVFDTADGRSIAHRATERFPLCSTFKLLLAGAVLARVDARGENLGRHIPYGRSDLLDYAPITTAHVADGSMTVWALCAAAIEWSDNTAANLLLTSLGGPPAITRYARLLGDKQTRLDRNEPRLNTALPGDLRDTTTPLALARDMQMLAAGPALSPASRARLNAWLATTRTGTQRLRAGLPSTWDIGDKTGSGERGTSNDVAVARPPGRKPIVLCALLTGSSISAAARDEVIADVARIAAGSLHGAS